MLKQTLQFLTRLPTRQDSVENRDKVYYFIAEWKERKYTTDINITHHALINNLYIRLHSLKWKIVSFRTFR